MRSAVLLAALQLKIHFTTGCFMKKLRIDVQLLLQHVVYITAIQKVLSAVNCPNTLNHPAGLFPNEIAYTSYSINNKTQGFQLPK